MEESAYAEWSCQLTDVMYDVNDIIDLARLKGNMTTPDHPSSSSHLSSFSHVRTHHDVALKIRSVNKKIENILKDKAFLELSSTPRIRNGSIWTPKKTANLVEPNLVGKTVLEASKEIVDLVFKHNRKKVYKIAIVGTGGVGKTTLAQKLFNDKKIEQRFNKVAWVCVSKDHLEESLLREVLQQMKVPLEQDESVAALQRKLKSAIEDKSFFLVLDDVWKSDTWTHLLRVPLHSASMGIVVVTTQQYTISLEIDADHTHRVDLMEVDEGWELLWKSMNIDEEEKVRHLRDIRIEIVRGCGGLPLIITVIAKDLASKGEEENEWRREELFVGDPKKPESNKICKVRRISTVSHQDMVSLPSMDKEKYKKLPLAVTKLCNLRQLGLGGTPITELPCLKYLRVQEATNVTKIGPELLGCCVGNLTPKEAVAFPKLEWLIIEDMPNWEEWSFVEGDEQVAMSLSMRLLPCLKGVNLFECPKLRGLPPQFGQEASSLECLLIRGANCLKTVDDFPFLSETFSISECEGLERVSNLPQVRKLYLYDCPNLRCVEEVGNFKQLWIDACMKDNPEGWVNGLLEQGRRRLGDDLDVYVKVKRS
ncbi:hypothetical protein ABZP36_008739 [Zizania latifolia]